MAEFSTILEMVRNLGWPWQRLSASILPGSGLRRRLGRRMHRSTKRSWRGAGMWRSCSIGRLASWATPSWKCGSVRSIRSGRLREDFPDLAEPTLSSYLLICARNGGTKVDPADRRARNHEDAGGPFGVEMNQIARGKGAFRLDLHGAYLRRTNLSRCNLKAANLSGADFTRRSFRALKFPQRQPGGDDLAGRRFDRCDQFDRRATQGRGHRRADPAAGIGPRTGPGKVENPVVVVLDTVNDSAAAAAPSRKGPPA